jgi:hypothetical protein
VRRKRKGLRKQFTTVSLLMKIIEKKIKPCNQVLTNVSSYLKVKFTFITIALNKSSFVKHITILTAGNYRKSNTYVPA